MSLEPIYAYLRLADITRALSAEDPIIALADLTGIHPDNYETLQEWKADLLDYVGELARKALR